MPNRWTGTWNVAVQAGFDAVNTILAAQHRDERYPHTLRLHLPVRPVSHGDEPARADPGTDEPWGRAGATLPAHLRPARGLLELQAGAPRLLVPRDAGHARLAVQYPVMAHFLASADSGPAPEFAHFNLLATVDVDQAVEEHDAVLTVALDSDDLDVQYMPMPGVPIRPGEPEKIQRIARSVLRRAFQPVDAVLDTDQGGDYAVRGVALHMFYGGDVPAAGVLLNVREGEVTAGARPGELFVHDRGSIGVALGRDFIVATLQEVAERQLPGLRFAFGLSGLPTPPPPTLCDMTFTVAPERASVELLDGRFRLTISGTVTTTVDDAHPGLDVARRHCRDVFRPFDWTVVQELTASIDGFGRIAVRARGTPSVDTSIRLLDSLLDHFSGRVSEALNAFVGEIEAAGTQALEGALASFDRLMRDTLRLTDLTMRWSQIGIDPDAVIVRGTPRLAHGFGAPVIRVATRIVRGTAPGSRVLELDGFETWIPGGSVSHSQWRVRGTTAGEARYEDHTFVCHADLLDVPGGVPGWPPVQWTFEITGTQPDMRGTRLEVRARASGFASLAPPPVGRGGSRPPALSVMDRDGKALGVYSPWVATPGATTVAARSHLLVHVAPEHGDWRVPLGIVRDALRAQALEKAEVLVVVVPPPRTLVSPEIVRQFPAFAWAAEADGAWRRIFDAPPEGCTCLVGPAGQRVWRARGALDRAALVAALVQHVSPRSDGRHVPHAATALRAGSVAPDFVFDYAPGRRLSLRRFRGRRIVLVFWTPGDEACLDALRRAESMASEGGAARTLALGIVVGEDARTAAGRLREAGITMRVVGDADGQVTSRYGVAAWPAIVSIDENGRLATVTYGS